MDTDHLVLNMLNNRDQMTHSPFYLCSMHTKYIVVFISLSPKKYIKTSLSQDVRKVWDPSQITSH